MLELDLDGRRVPAGRVFCIGRNYAEHARELNNPVPAEPVVFMKPAASLVGPDCGILYPAHGEDLQFETEIVLLLGQGGAIDGLSLGLDLTLRDVQSRLKAKGLPWERAKAFEQSGAVGRFVEPDGLPLDDLRFECRVKGELRQSGHSADMLFPIPRLLEELARVWRLAPGDLVYTGTPSGVGSLARGDRIEVSADWFGRSVWAIL